MKQSGSSRVFTSVPLTTREGVVSYRTVVGAKPVNVGLSNGHIVLVLSADAKSKVEVSHTVRILSDNALWSGGTYIGSVYFPNNRTLHVVRDAE